jgi:hypothetical protein
MDKRTVQHFSQLRCDMRVSSASREAEKFRDPTRDGVHDQLPAGEDPQSVGEWTRAVAILPR